MLYPQSNPFRQCIDLSGFWDFRFDPSATGITSGWASGFDDSRPIAVPGSWNDQFEENRDYLDDAWYQTRFNLPWGWQGKRILLRFNSVNYCAEVWLNGTPLGEHEGGHLPFIFDVTEQMQPEDNVLVVRVEGRMAPDRVPPGNVPRDPRDAFAQANFPPGSFDFFPFAGIQRPVLLYAVPQQAIDDITVVTDIEGNSGRVHVKVVSSGGDTGSVRCTLRGHGHESTQQGSDATFEVPNAALWAPGSPNLYELTVEALDGGTPIDRYTLSLGIRTIRVVGEQILLNGKPIILKGFGRHEDFPVAGRGLVPAVVVKDYALLEWVGANSFRTTHYPYSEQMMDLADRLGFLIIDEIPAVGLFFAHGGLDRRLALCRQQIEELIARDKNHPSVIMWSLANEPHSWPHPERASAKAFFRDLYDLAKGLDSTRPATVVSHIGVQEESFEFLDVMCLNRYYGWYSQSGQLDDGCRELDKELEALHELHPNKPLIMTEFGADAIPGWHAQPPELFSEEYQAEMILRYIEILSTKSYVAGYHVWNLCDFKTAQAIHRVGGLNLKGIFTRDRRPKLAAHRLRALWNGS